MMDKDWTRIDLDNIDSGATVTLERNTVLSGVNSALARGVIVRSNGYLIFVEEDLNVAGEVGPGRIES